MNIAIKKFREYLVIYSDQVWEYFECATINHDLF